MTAAAMVPPKSPRATLGEIPACAAFDRATSTSVELATMASRKSRANHGTFLFLDADDVLLPHAFETMSTHLDAHPEAGAAYNLHRLIDDNDLPLTSDDEPPSGTMRFEPILFGCLGARPIPLEQPETPLTALASYHQAYPSCTYFRREAFERAGLGSRVRR